MPSAVLLLTHGTSLMFCLVRVLVLAGLLERLAASPPFSVTWNHFSLSR